MNSIQNMSVTYTVDLCSNRYNSGLLDGIHISFIVGLVGCIMYLLKSKNASDTPLVINVTINNKAEEEEGEEEEGEECECGLCVDCVAEDEDDYIEDEEDDEEDDYDEEDMEEEVNIYNNRKGQRGVVVIPESCMVKEVKSKPEQRKKEKQTPEEPKETTQVEENPTITQETLD